MSTKDRTQKLRYLSGGVHSSAGQRHSHVVAGSHHDTSSSRTSPSTQSAGSQNYKKPDSNTHLRQNISNETGLSPVNSQLGPWNNWKLCKICSISFKNAGEYLEHLRSRHCARDRALFICKYGEKGVCSSSASDGITGEDYDNHIARDHAINMDGKY